MKKQFLAMILCALASMCLASACSNEAPRTTTAMPSESQKLDANVYGKGDKLSAKSYDFTLHEIVFKPDYDTSTHTAYGVVFLMGEAKAPLQISNGSHRSLVDMTLSNGKQVIKSTEITFVGIDDIPSFGGKATFIFRIENSEEMPLSGTFLYTEDENNPQTYNIDLSDLIVPDKPEQGMPPQTSTPKPPVFPMDFHDFGLSKTISGYTISTNVDGETTITFLADSYFGFSEFSSFTCTYISKGVEYHPTSKRTINTVGDSGSLGFVFESLEPPETITIMSADVEGQIIASFEVADEQPEA